MQMIQGSACRNVCFILEILKKTLRNLKMLDKIKFKCYHVNKSQTRTIIVRYYLNKFITKRSAVYVESLC